MKKTIENNGYWIGEASSKKLFIKLGQELGSLTTSRIGGNKIDELVPKKKSETKKNSLSKEFGLQEFPYHTDCAYQLIPPKYIALRYIGHIKSQVPTRIKRIKVDLLTTDEKYFLKNKMWYVTNGIKSFYSTIYNRINESDFRIRYDPVCMKLVDDHSKLSKKWNSIINKFPVEEIFWTPNKVIILDNWKILHSRGSVPITENESRKIQRLNIKTHDKF